MAKASVLGAKPKQVYEKAVVGSAMVKIIGDKVRVKFDDVTVKDDRGREKTIEGETYKFSRSDLPKLPKIAGDVDPAEHWVVRLNKDKDAIEEIRPYDGMYKVKLVDFTRPNGKDKPPCFYEVENKWEKDKPDIKKFAAHLQIIDGFWKGVKIYISGRNTFHYKFQEDGEGSTCWSFDPAATGKYKSPNGLWLKKFCEVAELLDSPVEWPEDGNILPELLERAEENQVKFMAKVEDGGWVTDVFDLKMFQFAANSATGDDEEEIEDEPMKSSNKKSDKELTKELGFDDDDM